MPNDVNTKAKSGLKSRKMSNTDSPLGKSSRQQKPASHEYCQGYVDRNGIWNNGFYCPRWGSPDDTYCCGDSERFCCPEVVHAHTPPPANSSPSQSTALSSATGNADLSSLLPLIIGASVGSAVLILVLLLICVCCPCCPCHKDRRRPKRSSNPITSNRTLSFSMEAEATSAVIAAQALQLAPGVTAGTQACSTGSTSDDGHLHCGCRWSPSTSQSTMVDVDSIIASLQQNTSLPWQTEMQDNAFNCATCEHHRPQFVRILKQQNSEQVCHVLSLSAGNNSLDRSDGNRSSPLCLDSFRPPSASSSRQTDFSAEPRFVRLPVSMERSCLLGNRNPQQLGQQSQQQRGGYMLSSQPGTDPRQVKSFLDSDRQRRDSGVLVEEPDLLNDTANAFLALSMLQTQTDQTGGGRTADVERRN